MKGPGELEIIGLMRSALALGRKRNALNDDVAFIRLKDQTLALKCDMLAQGTDVPRRMQKWQIARKSIVSSLSDLACKGAKPLAVLVSLAVPRDFTRNDIAELARGFRAAEREFGVKIVGGDTNEGKELIIDCCAVGLVRKTVTRAGAKKWDAIITSGPFGYSSAGLKILQDHARAYGGFRKRALRAVLMPRPRLKFGLALAAHATSSMDSSDGLAITLHELSRQSGKRFVLERLPVTHEVGQFARLNRYDLSELVLHGGEEYEIVATIPAAKLAGVTRLARNAGNRLFKIGRVESGKGIFLEEHGHLTKIKRRGWEHLA